MDEFLRDIHTLLFKEWILNQSIEGCEIKEEGKKIIISTPYCHGEVIFNDHNLIEFPDAYNESCHFFIQRNVSMC